MITIIFQAALLTVVVGSFAYSLRLYRQNRKLCRGIWRTRCQSIVYVNAQVERGQSPMRFADLHRRMTGATRKDVERAVFELEERERVNVRRGDDGGVLLVAWKPGARLLEEAA